MIVPRLTEDLVHGLPFAKKNSYYCTESGRHEDGKPVRAQNGDRPVPGFGVRIHRRHKSYVVRWQGKPHFLADAHLVTLEEARTRARRKFLELKEGPPPARVMAQQKTLLDLFRKHMEGVEAKLRAGEVRPRTVQGYQHLWGKHFERWENDSLDRITVERLEEWKAGMAATPVAFNRALQQLHAAFRLALRLKWVEENPCEAVEPYGERPAARCLSPEEIAAWANALSLLDSLDRLTVPEVAALWALFYSGARPGEILGARREWMHPVATPEGALVRLELPRAKGDRNGRQEGRVVRIPPPAGMSLLELDEGLGRDEVGPLFNVGLSALRRAFALVCATAGITGATPKVLRHVWRSVAPESGVDKEHLRQLGGWASHRVPDSVYVHERDEALDAGAVRIAERLKEVSGG